MFIIPCKFDPERPIIFECVERIQKFHPGEEIVVVDSDSNDKTYLERLEKDFSVNVIDACNRNYATAGYFIGFSAFDNHNFYYMIHDSLLLNRNINHVEYDDFTTVRHFFTPDTGWGWDQDGIILSEWSDTQMRQHMGMPVWNRFTGILGPMFMAKNDVVKSLVKSGFFNILPETKYHLCAMERIAGIALEHCGYDPSNSLQGEMWDFFGNYDETFVEKVFQLRP